LRQPSFHLEELNSGRQYQFDAVRSANDTNWPTRNAECESKQVSESISGKVHMRVLSKSALGLGFVLLASSFGFGGNRDLSQPLYNIVAVGRGRGVILLATLAAPPGKLNWRFRKIPAFPQDSMVRRVVLSASGTKALVVFANGTPRVFDLTKRITEINADEDIPPQHRLPGQLFPYASKGTVCLLDDVGESRRRGCKKALAAAVQGDGRVLYALDDGRLVIAMPGGELLEELPYRLPKGAWFRLLAGQRGDARDFLVLTTKREGNPSEASTVQQTEVIDPRLPAKPLGEFSDETVAELYAQLEFAQIASTTSSEGVPSNAALALLVKHLDEETRPGEFQWSFYRPVVNAELYAPILEFAPGEPAYPSDVNIWKEIRERAHGNSRQAYEAAYASLGNERWLRCASYIRTLSFPGAWLIEYWFYYPFDEGRPHPHIHDSEHLFVEVDKLGGTVRGVYASDHDSFVPNNLYSTLVKHAKPVSLPLFAMVELGKHAMAPDLDHDGRFIPGVDDNLHHGAYSFWGLRDRGNDLHFVMEPYRASMSLPRDPDDRFALKDVSSLFPGINVPPDHQTCSLRVLPDDPPCPNCDPASATAGVSHLVDHSDFRKPENIFKPYVLPWREVRLGVAIYDWRAGRGQISAAYVGDFRHMTGGLLRIPARLALEYMWSPRRIEAPISVGSKQEYTDSKSTMWAGVQIERLVTNMQGFYFGVTPEWADISTRVINGVLSPSDSHWQYTGVSYHVGYLFELPSEHKGNITNQIGIEIQRAPAPVLFEWRVNFGFLRRRGRHDFAARRGDHNPYE
jgi:hypothetical protein